MSDSQRGLETRFLKSHLQALDKDLSKAVAECLVEMKETLAENIFDNFPDMIAEAASKATPTAASWCAPVNKVSLPTNACRAELT